MAADEASCAGVEERRSAVRHIGRVTAIAFVGIFIICSVALNIVLLFERSSTGGAPPGTLMRELPDTGRDAGLPDQHQCDCEDASPLASSSTVDGAADGLAGDGWSQDREDSFVAQRSPENNSRTEHTERDFDGLPGSEGADGSFAEGPLATPSFLLRAAIQGRALAAGGNASSAAHSGTSDTEEEHGEHNHPHVALFFLFIALLIGTMVLQASTHPKLHGVQHTVALFVLGLIYSLLHTAIGPEANLGMLGDSYSMWMGIDPHLLLFSMLPVLLTGDAMIIDTGIARKVAGQCIYLAAPGVLLCSFLTALFISFYFDWSFMLSLTAGAILSATDPVAVVGLLKQLGAAPSLTVQIAGESLLNDGTAIVLYTMAYQILQGTVYDVSEIIIFLARTVLGALGLGWLIGWVFVLWIQSAENRFEHHSSTIQIALTICCAYCSFIIAEGLLHISGVLCTVSASLVLADQMWPSIVERDSMGHVWHMLEYIGNTIIFFLAGALTGKSMADISWQDYFHLLVLYVFLFTLRGVFLFISRPVLRLLSLDGDEVTRAEATIMTWGGLRGAVGLALAIQVNVDRASDNIGELESKRILFFTGGIAFLTLVVNATTCPMLVKWLRLTQPDRTQQVMMLFFHKQLLAKAFARQHSPACHQLLKEVLADSQNKIASVDSSVFEVPRAAASGDRNQDGNIPHDVTGAFLKGPLAETKRPNTNPSQRRSSSGSRKDSRISNQFRHSMEVWQDILAMKLSAHDTHTPMTVCERFVHARSGFVAISNMELSELPTTFLGDEYEKMRDVLSKSEKTTDAYMLCAVYKVFLILVRACYWDQIEHGEFVEGGSHAELLLNSISFAFPKDRVELMDFAFIMRELGLRDELSPEEQNRSRLSRGNTKNKLFESGYVQTQAKALVDSLLFNICLTLAISTNIMHIFVEGSYRKEHDNHAIWVMLEIIFNVLFLVEFMIKIVAFRVRYFCSLSNLFDFTLLLFGILGIIMDVWEQGSEVFGSDAQVARTSRVFRAMRVIRVFRLIRFLQLVRAKLERKEISEEMATDVRALTVLTAFTKGHMKAQELLVEYFGSRCRFSSLEQAQCILESQTCVYRAVTKMASTAAVIDPQVLQGWKVLRDATHTVQDLNRFIVKAHALGVLNALEADALLAPILDHSRIWASHIKSIEMGILRRDTASSSDLAFGQSGSTDNLSTGVQTQKDKGSTTSVEGISETDTSKVEKYDRGCRAFDENGCCKEQNFTPVIPTDQAKAVSPSAVDLPGEINEQLT